MPTTLIESWTSLIIQAGALGLLALIVYKAPTWIHELMDTIAGNSNTLIKTMAAERTEYLKAAREERDAMQRVYREELQRDRESFISRNTLLEAALRQEAADVKRGQSELKQGQSELKQGQDDMKSHLGDIKEGVRKLGDWLEQPTNPGPSGT